MSYKTEHRKGRNIRPNDILLDYYSHEVITIKSIEQEVDGYIFATTKSGDTITLVADHNYTIRVAQ